MSEHLVSIRYATKEDVGQLYTLGRSVPEFSVNDETVNFWPKSLLERATVSKDTLIIIAEENKKVTGFIIAIYNEGLRKAIIENLLDQLGKKECEYISTLIPLGADFASKLYESVGFSKGGRFMWLDKSLSSKFNRTSV